MMNGKREPNHQDDFKNIKRNDIGSNRGQSTTCVGGNASASRSHSSILKKFEKSPSVQIQNIPASLGKIGLAKLFGGAGKIKSAYIIAPKFNTSTEIVFGYLQFSSVAEAERAIELFNGKPPLNLIVKMNLSKSAIQKSAGRGTGANNSPYENVVGNCSTSRTTSAVGTGSRGGNHNSQRGGFGHNYGQRGEGTSSYSENGGRDHQNESQQGLASYSGDLGSGDGWSSPNTVADSRRGLLPTPARPPSNLANKSSSSSVHSVDDSFELGATAAAIPSKVKEKLAITCSVAADDHKRSVQLLADSPKFTMAATSSSISDRFAKLNKACGMDDTSVVDVGPLSPEKAYLPVPHLEPLLSLCAVCMGTATSRCSNCKIIGYCSKTCQETSWPQHRQLCKLRFQPVQCSKPSNPIVPPIWAVPPPPIVSPLQMPSTSVLLLTPPVNAIDPPVISGFQAQPSLSNYNARTNFITGFPGEKSPKEVRTNPGYVQQRPTSSATSVASSHNNRVGAQPRSNSGQSQQSWYDRSSDTAVPTQFPNKLPIGPENGSVKVSSTANVSNAIRTNAERSIVESTSEITEPIKLPPANLFSDKSVEVVLIHVFDPSHFYLQVADNLEQFNKIMKLMKANENAMVVPVMVGKGDLLCCKFGDDGMWYRIEVLKVESTAIRVRYIDYGNCANVDRKDLRSLCPYFPPTYINSPRQAVKCALDDVEALSGQWSSEASNTFHRFCNSGGQNLYARLVTRAKDGTAFVTLTQGQENGMDIGQALRLKGLAQLIPRITSSCIGSWASGQDIRLLVTSLEKPDVIWAKCCSNLSSEVAEELFVQLSVKCKDLPPVDESKIKVNDLVAAKSTEDGNWYRATVIDRIDTGWIVRYLDQGNAEVVTSLHPLPEHFHRVPSLAVLLRFEPRHQHQLLANNLSLGSAVSARLSGDSRDVNTADILVHLNENSPEAVLPAMARSVWLASQDETVSAGVESLIAAHHAPTGNSSAADENLALTPLPPKTALITGDEVTLNPIHLDSLTSFHVQVINDQTIKIVEVLDDLSEACLADPDLDMSGVTPVVGQMVCALDPTDNMWYRGVVLEVGSNGAPVTVRFVDYGNEGRDVQVRSVPPAFRHFPMVWREVMPLISLTNATFQALSQLLNGYEGNMKATVVDGDQLVPTVRLRNLDGVSLDDMLLTCVPLPPLEAVVAPAEATPAMALMTEDKEITFTLFTSSYVQLDVGIKEEVIVIGNASPTAFMIRRPNHEVERALERMSVAMSTFFELNPRGDYVPQLFDIVIVKSILKGTSCRAMVLNIDETTAAVSFLDFGGDDETVGLDMVTKMPSIFMNLPLQAIQCFLEGMNPDMDVPQEKTVRFSERFPLDSLVSVEVVSKTADGCHEVRIIGYEDAL